MPTYKFNYFDLRGRGEICRLCFYAAGVAFEDRRIDRAQWPGEHKAETPFGQLPYLEIDGKKFAQSIAIAQYIARENGLYGSSSLDALAIDGVVGLTMDYFMLWARSFFEADAAKKTELQTKLRNEDLPKLLGNLDRLLTQNGTGYFVGSKLSLADLSVYDVLENSYRDFPDAYSSFPKIVENRKRIADVPTLKSYLSTRRQSEI